MTRPLPFLTASQLLERLSSRLQELEGWRDLARLPVPAVTFTDAHGQTTRLRGGEPWPGRAFPVVLEAQPTVPEAWHGRPVALHADVGGEALLHVNGQAVGGVNPYHREHRLRDTARGGEVLDVRLSVSPRGLFGEPNRAPVLAALHLLVPDEDVRALHDDLAVSLDAARTLLQENREEVAVRVLDVVDAAFRLLPLPRGEGAAYLARVSQGAVERRRLDSLWDEYDHGRPDAAPYPDGWRPALRAAREALRSGLDRVRAAYPPVGQLALTGHAHIDLAWLWPLAETRRKVRRTFSTVLGLMDRYPDFRFNQSMAQLYAFVLEDDPALFERIRARVQGGRWEVVGGMWVEPDGNLLSGESWARQLLHGQRFFGQHFGRRASVCWLPDTFGYAGNLPQFLVGAGLDSFFTTKLTWNDTNRFPHDLYVWEALDGSRVVAHLYDHPEANYNADIAPADVSVTWRNFRGKRWHDESLMAFGYGDGGGGPSAAMLERFGRLRDFPGLPKLHMTDVGAFFARVNRDALPVWVGEQYFELHRGTYTTQGRVKWLHRRLEHVLPEAEAAGALAARTVGRAYPREALWGLWQVLLRNQFHDILPGSSVQAVYADAHQELADALTRATALRDAALSAMSEHVPGEGEVAWNLSLDDRECRGVRVPPLGYARVPPATPVGAGPGDLRLENECLRVDVNPDGTLGSVWLKGLGREALGTEADGSRRGNQLIAFVDVPRRWEAWDVDPASLTEGVEVLASAAPVRLDAHGIQVTRTLNGSRFTQVYRLPPGSRRLDIHTLAHWQEKRTLLRSHTRVNVRALHGTTETACGTVTRTTHANTGWDAAQFEVPALRWADLSEPDFGVALLNDGKYGHSLRGDVLGLSLLRGPLYPDPTADEGEHRFTYSLFPHEGDWRGPGLDGAAGQAADLNAPLVLLAQSGGPGADWPESDALLRVAAPPGVRLGTLKAAEDADLLLLRVYEAHGTRGELRVQAPRLGVSAWRAANLLEEPGGEPGTLWPYTPYRVVTLLEVAD